MKRKARIIRLPLLFIASAAAFGAVFVGITTQVGTTASIDALSAIAGIQSAYARGRGGGRGGGARGGGGGFSRGGR